MGTLMWKSPSLLVKITKKSVFSSNSVVHLLNMKLSWVICSHYFYSLKLIATQTNVSRDVSYPLGAKKYLKCVHCDLQRGLEAVGKC